MTFFADSEIRERSTLSENLPTSHRPRYHFKNIDINLPHQRGCPMPAVTIRNLPEETHRALKQRAASHGRSTEAEIRDILEEAVKPGTRVKLGSELAAFGRRFGGLDLDVPRDPAATEAATFE